MKLENWKQLKVRSDLVVSPQSQEGQTVYVVKDPVTLRYFRLRPVEYAIFRMLDGRTSFDDMKARLKLTSLSIEDEELTGFLAQLGAANFYENVLPNQSESLFQAAQLRRRRRSLFEQAKRILYVKVPLVDPDRAFTKALPYVRFLWSRWMVALYAALVAFAVYAFWARYDEVSNGFSGLLAPDVLVILAVIFLVEKAFHELGHGLTCKYFGGEVHDMGILVLVLMPCMYCNISDAWILEKHSRKFWISAAGIATEVILASLAAVVWWATEPGALNTLSFRVMMVAGVSSVLFNGNPLMKWDGYYILSDILGMPNLRANSLAYMKQFFRKYVLGMRVPAAGAFDRSRLILLVYGVLSSAWITLIMYRITAGLLVRMPAIGVWVLITTVYGLTLIPLARLIQHARKRKPGAPDVDLRRLSAVSAVLALGVFFLFFHDMGYSVSAPCAIEPARRQIVTSAVSGILAEMPWKQGDLVREGDVIARVENPRLASALEQTALEIRHQRALIDQALFDGRSLETEVLEAAIRRLEADAGELRRRVKELEIRAPFTGTIISPVDESAVGNFVFVGTQVCEMADLSSARVTIAVADRYLRFVREDAPASLRLRAYPWRRFRGTVASVSSTPMEYLPNAGLSSASAGPVMTRRAVEPGGRSRPASERTGAYRAEVPLQTLYQVSIILPNDDRELLMGMVGKASISSDPRKPIDVIYTWARETFRRSFGV